MNKLFTVGLAASTAASVEELRSLLADLPLELVPFEDLVPDPPSIAAHSETLEANAASRARNAANLSRCVVLVAESGLEVESLGGRPGVQSARYAHGLATDAENNAALLRDLAGVPTEQRGARFRTVLALARPGVTETPVLTEGTCEGVILNAEQGSGVGYDPLFALRGLAGRTLAEIDSDERAKHGHFSRAVIEMRPALIRLINELLSQVERVATG